MPNINEMTMEEITARAVELGFPKRKEKGEPFFHWNFSREKKAVDFLRKNDPELFDDPDDAA